MRWVFVINEDAVSQPVRRPLDPTPRFRPDRRAQLDFLLGNLEAQVSAKHLCREVWRIVERLDTSVLEKQYSALGRHGYHPKRLLAVWVYASLIGLHHSTKVARACQTDAAFRWLCGGDSPSGATLRRMRMKQAAFFAAAIEQTIVMAHKYELVDLDALAVDSMRLRAHAAGHRVRTVARSTKRLKELHAVDRTVLDEAAQARHDASIAKHTAGLAACEVRGMPSIVTTNPNASLMKFPSGASAPAHRMTVVASGASARFVIGVFVDADPTDHGKLGPALIHARATLDRLGLREDRRLTAAADAGYASDRDLQFAVDNRDWVDVLMPTIERFGNGRRVGFFPREQFEFREDGVVICPAGRQMLGPYNNDKAGTILKWVGPNCHTCALKSQCTPGPCRYLQLSPAKEKARLAMVQRMALPGAKQRYDQRIATVEPVFSFLEDAMAFRRCASRAPQTVQSEVFLQVLAYNIDRLIRAERDAAKLSCVFILVVGKRFAFLT
jgi:transposase